MTSIIRLSYCVVTLYCEQLQALFGHLDSIWDDMFFIVYLLTVIIIFSCHLAESACS